MTELEKIAYAKSFIDKLANGINPLDDLPLSETDVASNARLSKCFFYVSDILRQVIENEGVHPAKTTKPQKNEFGLSEEARGKLRASKAPKTVSEISNCLNELIDSETTKQISAVAINQWLVELQLLEATAMPNGKNGKAPTAQGEELGIFTKEKQGRQGTYTVVLFSESAQRFIYDNLDGVIAFVAANAIERSEKKEKKEKKDRLSGFHGRPWTEEHDKALTDLFQKNASVSEMAYALKRTEEGIRARLKRLGLIENRRDAR